MTIGVANSAFVDTNVLVYANLTSAPFHADARRFILMFQSVGTDLWINRQVLREYLAVVTRQTFVSPLPVAQAISDIRQFEQQFTIADETTAVTTMLLTLLQSIPLGGKQVHDANIVATMLVHGVERLLTHNVSDFMRFSHLVTVVPIVTSSASTTT